MTMVALDYGRKRTGTAIQLEGLILPGEPVLGGWDDIIQRLKELSGRHGELLVILGLPLSALGKTTELCGEVEALAARIRSAGYEVETVNEAGSTASAAALRGGRDRRGRVDSVAACTILQRYLDERRT
ncbi:MAG TPA: RuvX/YqgF family protein [Candidatus Sabulitectum sp.]|jgi:RNase H-fold protein (predicted Holliday junction resolvase)|nr:RuvX/YqgF family protein [Candidatus Sabulitectum sp.]HPJ28745.1 RuvX/YqgF family protein [Candidatus Sabulitectum sp.]HPR22410.1 RuvX/YqgF family protein [Candidatus Sabulitectum sp.]HRW78282.1 RuvX/YqgF family protein [Candidatus Sabulitectum sp.]